MSAADFEFERRYVPGAGIPLAPPTGFPSATASTLVDVNSGQIRGMDTSPAIVCEARKHRVSRRALDTIAANLSDRDHAVLARLNQHGYLTTHQLQRFAFERHASEGSAKRTTRRVLARLERDGLIRALARRIGGARAGSGAAVWQLAHAGVRLLRSEGARVRAHEPTVRFLAHSLAVADVHLLLRDHDRIEAIESVRIDIEPVAWRRYSGPGGEVRWLQPDLYATLTMSDFVDRYFIEVDLGSEGMQTLLDKCRQYEDYRRSGIEQQRHDAFPLVIWVFDDPARAERLAATVTRSASLTAAMYRFATPESLTEVLAGGAS